MPSRHFEKPPDEEIPHNVNIRILPVIVNEAKQSYIENKPTLSYIELASIGAPVAQLDRASDYESEGRRFESCRAYHVFRLSA